MCFVYGGLSQVAASPRHAPDHIPVTVEGAARMRQMVCLLDDDLFRGSLFNPPAEAGDFPFKDHGMEYAQVVRVLCGGSLECFFYWFDDCLPANLSCKIGN